MNENKNKYCGSWNFGPSVNETMRVKNIVKLFFKFLKSKKKIVFKKGNFKETNLLKLNSSKALKNLNWKNKWSMRMSILKTAKWYEHYLNKKDLREVEPHRYTKLLARINPYFFTYKASGALGFGLIAEELQTDLAKKSTEIFVQEQNILALSSQITELQRNIIISSCYSARLISH